MSAHALTTTVEGSTVFCQYHKAQLPAIEEAPLPGDFGDYILKNISNKAWQTWISEQTKIINEFRLNLISKEDRTFIIEQCRTFLKKASTVKIDGYVPQAVV